jgi:hypothetical protein
MKAANANVATRHRYGDVIVAVGDESVSLNNNRFNLHVKLHYKVGHDPPLTILRKGKARAESETGRVTASRNSPFCWYLLGHLAKLAAFVETPRPTLHEPSPGIWG